MDDIKYQPPTSAEFRSARYHIHRNVHGLEVEAANDAADADLAKWQSEKEAERAADAMQVAA